MATVTVVTDSFVNLAKAQARALGRPDLRLVVVPQPFDGGIGESLLRQRGQEMASHIEAELIRSGSNEVPSIPTQGDSAGPTNDRYLELSVDSTDEVSWQLYRMDLTDGFAVIEPTPDRVERMLAFAHRDRDCCIGPVPPRMGSLTMEVAAANAVMAGCLPEHFPVVWQAIEAMLDPSFNLYGVQTTTHPTGNTVMMSGPIAKELQVASGSGCLGPGWLANAAIGRAIRLILMNVGGARPGNLDKATLGQPGKFSSCFAENEAASPWPSWRIDAGYAADVTTITVIPAEAPHNIADHRTTTGEGILRSIAGTMTSAGNNNRQHWRGDTFVVIAPEHAAILHMAGLSRSDVQRELHRRARMPADSLSEVEHRYHQGLVSSLTDSYVDADGRIAVTQFPQEIQVLVAGGPGKHSMWFPTIAVGYSVTRVLTGRDGQPLSSIKG